MDITNAYSCHDMAELLEEFFGVVEASDSTERYRKFLGKVYGAKGDLLKDCLAALGLVGNSEFNESNINKLSTIQHEADTEPKEMNTVLIVEDDFVFGKILCHHLSQEGFNCSLESDFKALMPVIDEGPLPDIFILDYDLGNSISGLELCQKIKAKHHKPVFMLTADDSEETTVNCLNAGADQYLLKPYKKAELLARIRTALRTYPKSTRNPASSKGFSDLQIRLYKHHRVMISGNKSILLTEKETALLEFMLANIGLELSREAVHAALYGQKPLLYSRTIDVLMGRVRKKLKIVEAPYVINNLRSIGYIMHRAEFSALPQVPSE